MENSEPYENKIINADCLDVLRELPDKCVDLVLTDPPYGINYQSSCRINKYSKITNDNNLDWLPIILRELKRISKDTAIWFIFCSWHHIDKFKREIAKIKHIKNILIWNKNNFGCGDLKCDFAPKYEMIIYCNENTPLRGKRIANILNFAKTNNSLHPTQKPLGLFETLIEKASPQNDLVLDCFSGSGTTAVAAYNLGRRFICIEKDRGYWEASVKRLEDARKQISMFEYMVES